ncbi:hypothetical protein D3C71_1935700 [compost metagenome]
MRAAAPVLRRRAAEFQIAVGEAEQRIAVGLQALVKRGQRPAGLGLLELEEVDAAQPQQLCGPVQHRQGVAATVQNQPVDVARPNRTAP